MWPRFGRCSVRSLDVHLLAEYPPERIAKEMTLAKLRRNQELCRVQIAEAYRKGATEALETLQAWLDAYTEAVYIKAFDNA